MPDEFDHSATNLVDYQPARASGRVEDARPTGASSATGLSVGQIFEDRYLIIAELGRGGMGTVFRAIDKETQNECALKLLLPSVSKSVEALTQLKREVAIAVSLTHKNLRRVNHLEVKSDPAYIVMEYLDGEDLEVFRLRKGRLGSEEVRQLMLQILAGLDCLHSHGIVHLDMKPQNVMVLRSGEIKLADFGISRTIREQLADHESESIGTLCFMAPEQLRGELCTPRTDLYAIGIMLHVLLTGEFPFPTTTRHEVVEWHLGTKGGASRLPQEWAEIFAGCTSRDASNRFLSCQELSRVLEENSIAIPGRDLKSAFNEWCQLWEVDGRTVEYLKKLSPLRIREWERDAESGDPKRSC